jgi:HK97 gp10 family phage protein
MTMKFNKRALRQVVREPAVADHLLEQGWRIARDAAALAPVATQDSKGGAKSIRAEIASKPGEEPEVRISWDRAHFYMGFHEFGTEKQSPRPFLRPAASRYQ